MGGQGNETSGVAIGMRQRQSETAQFHLQDNLKQVNPSRCKNLAWALSSTLTPCR